MFWGFSCTQAGTSTEETTMDDCCLDLYMREPYSPVDHLAFIHSIWIPEVHDIAQVLSNNSNEKCLHALTSLTPVCVVISSFRPKTTYYFGDCNRTSARTAIDEAAPLLQRTTALRHIPSVNSSAVLWLAKRLRGTCTFYQGSAPDHVCF